MSTIACEQTRWTARPVRAPVHPTIRVAGRARGKARALVHAIKNAPPGSVARARAVAELQQIEDALALIARRTQDALDAIEAQ